jgi:hypothetical protein
MLEFSVETPQLDASQRTSLQATQRQRLKKRDKLAPPHSSRVSSQS